MKTVLNLWQTIKLGSLIAALISAIGLFLSLWIVIPAPVFSLLPLSVGAPEISPWLIVLNAIAIVLCRRSRFLWVASLFALGLSLLPLIQFPITNQKAAIAFQAANLETQLRSRSTPLNLWEVFRGITIPEVRQTKGIQFANSDGVPLKMNVYRPLRVGRNPAIVMIYGGAWRTGDPSANEEFSRYMAAQGYTVLAIDYRHSPKYRFPAHLEDVKTALKFIQSHADEYEVDRDRMVLMGRSAGAHLALLATFQDVVPVKGAIAYYSPVDLTEGYRNPPVPDPIRSRDVLQAFLGGTPKELAELYRQASPYEFVKPNLPPTLLIYGGQDHIVQSKYGRALYEKLKANGNKSVFIEIPWAEHSFDAVFNGVSNQLALYYTEQFLGAVLK
jgi:acetyl esterase/lipase